MNNSSSPKALTKCSLQCPFLAPEVIVEDFARRVRADVKLHLRRQQVGPDGFHIFFLHGVRGSGKTRLLRQALADAVWIDCESVGATARFASRPSAFNDLGQPPLLVLDEVTSLPDSSQLLIDAVRALPSTTIVGVSSKYATPNAGATVELWRGLGEMIDLQKEYFEGGVGLAWSQHQVVNLEAFVAALVNPRDSLSGFILSTFTPQESFLLTDYSADRTKGAPLRRALAGILERISRGPLIYTPDRFLGRTIAPDIGLALKESKTGEELFELNFGLLFDGYPQMLRFGRLCRTYTSCELTYAPPFSKVPSHGVANAAPADAGPESLPPPDRVIQTDLLAHLPRTSPSVAKRLLDLLARQCGQEINQAELLKRLAGAGSKAISRDHLAKCLEALKQCHLIAELKAFKKYPQAELSSEQIFLPNPSLIPGGPDETSAMGFRLLVWLHLRAAVGDGALHHWRRKDGHQLDFVIERERRDEGKDVGDPQWEAVAIQCAFDGEVNSNAFKVFRKHYHSGPNFVVVPDQMKARFTSGSTFKLKEFKHALEEDRLTPDQCRWEELVCKSSPHELLSFLALKRVKGSIRNHALLFRFKMEWWQLAKGHLRSHRSSPKEDEATEVPFEWRGHFDGLELLRLMQGKLGGDCLDVEPSKFLKDDFRQELVDLMDTPKLVVNVKQSPSEPKRSKRGTS